MKVRSQESEALADNILYYGDNLDILRRYTKDESVDLVYLDPPFKSNQDYNVLFQACPETGPRLSHLRPALMPRLQRTLTTVIHVLVEGALASGALWAERFGEPPVLSWKVFQTFATEQNHPQQPPSSPLGPPWQESKMSSSKKTLTQETLQEIIRRIVEVAQPERIILFGSAAKDEMGFSSDVDLLVVKGGQFDHRRLLGDIYMNLHGVGQAVDVILVTPDQVERYRNTHCLVIAPALREGREVYAS